MTKVSNLDNVCARHEKKISTQLIHTPYIYILLLYCALFAMAQSEN